MALINRNEAYASFLVSSEAITSAKEEKEKADEKFTQYANVGAKQELEKIVHDLSTWTSADVYR